MNSTDWCVKMLQNNTQLHAAKLKGTGQWCLAGRTAIVDSKGCQKNRKTIKIYGLWVRT